MAGNDRRRGRIKFLAVGKMAIRYRELSNRIPNFYGGVPCLIAKFDRQRASAMPDSNFAKKFEPRPSTI